jgi:uncharacterized protein DUF4174
MLTLLLVEMLMTAPLALTGPGLPTGVKTVEDARWERRVLLVFPGLSPEAWASQQRRLEEARRALDERDVLVVRVGGGPEAAVRLPDTQEARAHWKVAPGEGAVVLMGKDGEEKWRAALPTDLEPMFTLIDSMPMRQREMKDGSRR